MSNRYIVIGAMMIVLTLVANCGKTEPVATATPVPSPTPTIEAVSLPAFEPSLCRFKHEPGRDVECGYLIVPQDRGQLDGSVIRLHVAVFKSTNPNPAPDPVIHLSGGPGSALLDSSDYFLRTVGDEILQTRDYILFSQRGTHRAEPVLDCPGYVKFLRKLYERDRSREERHALEIEFFLVCQDDLLEQGINLSAYNSVENAADVNDLRIALGYEQTNLYGISYGAKLALTVMRDHPKDIRSVILDSVYPPQIGGYSERVFNASHAFDTLFESCAADSDCNQTYPDLETAFYQVVDELNTNPITLTVSGCPMIVDGELFVTAIFQSMYWIDPFIPQSIVNASKGDYARLEYALEALLHIASNVSLGMHYSTQCREEVPFESYETALALAADVPPQLAEVFASPFKFDLCALWESGVADSIENEPVVSDIPTLVMVGQYDPIVLPAHGKLVAETLSHSFSYQFPGLAHGVISSGLARSDRCGLGIALAFLDDPTTEPDVSCIDELTGPDFK